MKLWITNITNEDLNVNPGQFDDTQALMDLQCPGREIGFTAIYTF